MRSKILTICTLENGLVKKYHENLEYLPLSNEETDKSWETLIKRYHPKVIIFGLQTINEEKLSLWRQLQPIDNLKFVRKGTSLHRVDFAAAKKYRVDVLNTPGVNAPYVAQFVTDLLLRENKTESPIAVLGVGDIGKKVVAKLLEMHKQVILYNRSNPHFEGKNFIYSDNILDIFSQTKQIAISLPLNESTNGIITEQHIRAIPQNSQFVCISPPRVLSVRAVVALHERHDIHVTFDHVASGLTFIHEALGHQNLRKDFIFEEKAAAGHDCQYAMGEAAIFKALEHLN